MLAVEGKEAGLHWMVDAVSADPAVGVGEARSLASTMRAAPIATAADNCAVHKLIHRRGVRPLEMSCNLARSAQELSVSLSAGPMIPYKFIDMPSTAIPAARGYSRRLRASAAWGAVSSVA